ncbi:hypothetical protein C8R44DRAFT_622857, partial [Mycena epipterygia]
VATALLFYDYFLTLEWEISRYWGSAFTWLNILLFANRYGTLLGNIPVISESFWSTNGTPEKGSRCRHLESYHQYFIIATQALVAALLILRTYALYDRNKLVLAFMLSVTVGAIIVGIVGRSPIHWLEFHSHSCQVVCCHSKGRRRRGISLAAAWAGVAVFDCMIFLLTLYRACTRCRPKSRDLFTVLLRDGTSAFRLIIPLLIYCIRFRLLWPFTRGIAMAFTNIISSIMLLQLMLNLRDPALSHISRRSELNTEATMGAVPDARNRTVELMV